MKRFKLRMILLPLKEGIKGVGIQKSILPPKSKLSLSLLFLAPSLQALPFKLNTRPNVTLRIISRHPGMSSMAEILLLRRWRKCFGSDLSTLGLFSFPRGLAEHLPIGFISEVFWLIVQCFFIIPYCLVKSENPSLYISTAEWRAQRCSMQ